MILDEISLYNFGLYAGSQSIALTPPSPDKPIVLIGGLNGGGKTTLLDALQLCLFGPHARISNRASLSYQEYLSRSIYKDARASEASIKIGFRHTVDGREDQYSLHRSWHRNGSGCKEFFAVSKNGESEPTLADNWASQVEEFFPANIAHLFLFDGEQVEGYASKQDSSDLIAAGIHNLLGLDMVDRLDKDLLVYERRKRVEAQNDTVNTEIVAFQDDLCDLRKRIGALKQERAALRTHRIDRRERALRQVEDNYRKLGGTLYDEKGEIERRWNDAGQAVKAGESDLREIAAGVSPLLLVRVLLLSAESRDRHEEECRRARELLETLKARDLAVLRHLRSKSADQDTIKILKAFFSESRAEQQVLGKQEPVLNVSSQVRIDLRILLREGLDTTVRNIRKLLERQEMLVKEEARARIEQENVPSVDTIAMIAEERGTLRREIAELEVLYEAMGQDIVRQERELDRKQQALSRLIEADIKKQGARDDRTRILHHANRVRQTLGTFRRVVIERHLHRIEQLVLESYKQLLRKSALVTKLTIDPESYSLTLFGRDGDALSVERLSAGERQLLAVALLWGLAKASGRPLPTAIDTPLGRLDSGHRMHLVERYLPYASHQVLLLSTDEEIAGEYLERLRPWIGRTYVLSYDDVAGKTEISPGYLESPEAA